MMKKKVLYDSQIFDLQDIGGISRQFVCLFENLKRYEPIIGIEHTNNLYLFQYLLRRGFVPNNETNNMLYSMYLESTQRYDLFHATYFDPTFFQLVKKPIICTIHDMILERECETSDEVRKMLDSDDYSSDTKTQVRGKIEMIDKADAIIAVSEHTKKDIMRLFDCNPNKIHVCYPGSDEKFLTMTDDVQGLKNQLNFDYIFYVGGRKGTKNFVMFLDEFVKIHQKYPDLKLLCSGFQFEQEELELFQNRGLIGSVLHVTYATDEEMFTLYHNAKCFVFPSLYEGFGMPIIEAMMCGCPVLLNTTTCFPEIGGDVAIYFKLTKEENNFMEVFDKFMSMSEAEVDEYRKKGKERSKKFTIQEFTRKVEKVYDDVLAKYNNETKITNYVNI